MLEMFYPRRYEVSAYVIPFDPVSYTHLDVYKRQDMMNSMSMMMCCVSAWAKN